MLVLERRPADCKDGIPELDRRGEVLSKFPTTNENYHTVPLTGCGGQGTVGPRAAPALPVPDDG